MTMAERFSTAEIDSEQRVTYWNRICCQVYHPMTLEPRQRASFAAAVVRRSYGESLLSRASSTPATMRGHVHGRSPREPERAVVVLQERGLAEHEQDGKKVRLETGDITLLLAPRPYASEYLETTSLAIVELPYDQLAARIGDPRRHVASRIPAPNGALLGSFLRTLLDQVDVPGERDWGEAVSDVILDLLALTYRRSSSPDGLRSELGERWQRRVREIVERQLHDPELGAASIARRLEVTPRYVQMVFAGMTTTASRYILEQRLERAAQLLADRHQSVTEIAFYVGFSDLSYFYRTFRRRFGVSPSRYRHGQARL